MKKAAETLEKTDERQKKSKCACRVIALMVITMLILGTILIVRWTKKWNKNFIYDYLNFMCIFTNSSLTLLNFARWAGILLSPIHDLVLSLLLLEYSRKCRKGICPLFIWSHSQPPYFLRFHIVFVRLHWNNLQDKPSSQCTDRQIFPFLLTVPLSGYSWTHNI